jgi:hypothetical protein
MTYDEIIDRLKAIRIQGTMVDIPLDLSVAFSLARLIEDLEAAKESSMTAVDKL